MPIGIGCKIMILEDKISKTRELKKTAGVRYEKRLKKLRSELKKLKMTKDEQYEKRVTGLPSKKQLAKRRRVTKAKNKKLN